MRDEFGRHDIPIPTQVINRQEIRATVDAHLLAQAGKIHLTVRNPEPLAAGGFGGTSNMAHILVPFSFTTKWSHNKF